VAITLLSKTSVNRGLSKSQGLRGPRNGYVMGSITPISTSVQKMNMISETWGTIAATITVAQHGCAISNTGVAGYMLGGFDLAGTPQTLIQKISTPQDTKSNISSTLAAGKFQQQQMVRGNIAGYTPGGANQGYSTRFKTTDKLLYSTEIASTLGVTMAGGGNAGTGLTNGVTAGYHMGGYTDALGGDHTINDKFAYSSETFSTLAAALPNGQREGPPASNEGVAGYLVGKFDFGLAGGTYALSRNSFKVSFTTDAVSTLTNTLAAPGYDASSFTDRGICAYLPGMSYDTGYIARETLKFSFSSETASTITNCLMESPQRGWNNGWADCGVY
jgi:hypothetical protein